MVGVVVVVVVNATAAALCWARRNAATMLTVRSVFAIYIYMWVQHKNWTQTNKCTHTHILKRHAYIERAYYSYAASIKMIELVPQSTHTCTLTHISNSLVTLNEWSFRCWKTKTQNAYNNNRRIWHTSYFIVYSQRISCCFVFSSLLFIAHFFCALDLVAYMFNSNWLISGLAVFARRQLVNIVVVVVALL